MVELFIAKKYILERKKQSFISILGITIGIVGLIVSIAIANGLNKNMIDSILSITSHITVTNRQEIENYQELIGKIEGIEGIKGTIPAISSQGIVKYSGNYSTFVSGVLIEGYDLNSAIKTLDLDKKIVKGTIDPKNIKGILLGNELYEQMGAHIGDEIKIISAENKEFRLKIAGSFQSGNLYFDTNMVILPLKMAQYLTYGEDVVDKIEVGLYDPYSADEISRKIMLKTGIYAQTWGEKNKSLLSALALEKTVMILMLSLIVIIAGFVIWISLNMLVREKTKDIGILRAMGYSKNKITNIFLLQGIILGIVGIIIGVILSFCILYFIKNNMSSFLSSIYYIEKIPAEISIKELSIIVISNILIIILSSIFPAYKAARLETVEALKYE